MRAQKVVESNGKNHLHDDDDEARAITLKD